MPQRKANCTHVYNSQKKALRTPREGNYNLEHASSQPRHDLNKPLPIVGKHKRRKCSGL